MNNEMERKDRKRKWSFLFAWNTVAPLLILAIYIMEKRINYQNILLFKLLLYIMSGIEKPINALFFLNYRRNEGVANERGCRSWINRIWNSW